MNLRFAVPPVVLMCVVWVSTIHAQDPKESFRVQVTPFLTKHCVDCHGPKKAKGDLRLDTLKFDDKAWAEVRVRLIAKEMPPSGKPQPTVSERRPVLDWLGGHVIRQSRHVLAAPTEGNRVDHDLLFSAEAAKLPASTPAREWRVSPQIYFKILQDLDPDVLIHYGSKQDLQIKSAIKKFGIRYSQPFTSPATGFGDYSGSFTIDRPTAEVLIRNAKEVVKGQTSWQVDKDGKPVIIDGKPVIIDKRTQIYTPARPKGIPREFLVLMNPEISTTPAAMEAAIRKQFQLVLLRSPTDEELPRFLKLMTNNIRDAGQVDGIRGALATILLLREVVFRSEVGQGREDDYGRRMLGPRELAYAIAYALTDSRPDATLLAAAEAGKLTTREEVRSQVERILKDPQIEKPRIIRFFEEYFGYTGALQAFKDNLSVKKFQDAFGLKKDKFRYVPEVFVHDTDLLIKHILQVDCNVFEELLTTNKAYVNFNPRNPNQLFNNYAQQSGFEPVYNLTAWPGKDQPVSLPTDQRAGILTQPSWLLNNSFNDRTDPIHRGKWIREKLLGAAMPGVPTSVDATIPDDPHKTVRERLAGTQKEYCWNCHQKMNPLGLSLEMFDAFGRVRDTELGNQVDTTGSIDFSGDDKLNGPVKNGVEMLHKLAKSPRVRQVFIRHAFRYWLGRSETLHDASTLLAADRAYVESNGSMNALIVSFLTSDSFLLRSGGLRKP